MASISLVFVDSIRSLDEANYLRTLFFKLKSAVKAFKNGADISYPPHGVRHRAVDGRAVSNTMRPQVAVISPLFNSDLPPTLAM